MDVITSILSDVNLVNFPYRLKNEIYVFDNIPRYSFEHRSINLSTTDFDILNRSGWFKLPSLRKIISTKVSSVVYIIGRFLAIMILLLFIMDHVQNVIRRYATGVDTF